MPFGVSVPEAANEPPGVPCRSVTESPFDRRGRSAWHLRPGRARRRKLLRVQRNLAFCARSGSARSRARAILAEVLGNEPSILGRRRALPSDERAEQSGQRNRAASAATLKRVLSPLVSKDALSSTRAQISPEMDLNSMPPVVFTTSARSSSGTSALGEASRPRSASAIPALPLLPSLAGQGDAFGVTNPSPSKAICRSAVARLHVR